jgi:signal transduction histidine kinase
MRLSDIRRTTSFRLAMLFLLLFGTASVTLFGFMYWRTEGFLVARVDAWLGREQANMLRLTPGDLTEHVSGHAIYDPAMERPFALFGPDGKRLAGNPITLPQVMPPFDRPFDYFLQQGNDMTHYRASLHRLPSGEMLMIAETLENVREYDAVLTRAIGWGGLVTAVLGLIGAIITGVGAVRRIDAVTRAIQRIVGGDLSGRLPNGRASGDLDRLVYVVNGMLDEIERLMHEVKGVCDNIAHDLRTPLTRLLAGLERARRRATSVDEYAAAVDDAVADTKGVLRTFAAMLRISEVEDGARRAGFTTVDLGQIAADAIELYEPTAEAKGITLALRSEAEGRSEIRGDPSLLFEAVANLVDNAIKFTPAGGQVGVRIFHTQGRPGLAVSDTGPGIPPEEREAVLRRFYRMDKSGHSPGNGLGLSLVSAIARLHGMGLDITGAGPGCCVTLQLQEGAETSAAPRLHAGA